MTITFPVGERVDTRRIELTIDLPPGFPDSQRRAMVRAAELCIVNKNLEHPPEIVVRTSPRG